MSFQTFEKKTMDNTLTEDETQALHEALEDEYLSWTTYDQVVRDFGEVRPFINIRAAEARHIEALRTLYIRYEVEMPKNTWLGRVDRYPDLQTACEAGVKGEVANAEMYDRLLKVIQRPDMRRVLMNLQAASQQRHLPAFERCAQRGDGGQGGSGQGQGHGCGKGSGGYGRRRRRNQQKGV